MMGNMAYRVKCEIDKILFLLFDQRQPYFDSCSLKNRAQAWSLSY